MHPYSASLYPISLPFSSNLHSTATVETSLDSSSFQSCCTNTTCRLQTHFYNTGPDKNHGKDCSLVRSYIYPAIQQPPACLTFDDQFAYRPTGSTTAFIITILHKVTHLLVNNPIDYSKAFDESATNLYRGRRAVPLQTFTIRHSIRKLSIVMGLSTTFTQCAPETTKFRKITLNKGHFVVQGHSMSLILVPIESSCVNSRDLMRITCLAIVLV